MKFLLITFFFLLVSNAFSQTKTFIYPTPTPPPPPGNIKMLPRYVHKIEQGIDTAVGNISKENGLRIEYDIGFLAGNYAMGKYSRQAENINWFKTQMVNNHNLMIVYLKDGKIYATFDKSTNFYATIRKDEELADFLLMIMTYGSEDSPKKEDVKKSH